VSQNVEYKLVDVNESKVLYVNWGKSENHVI